MAAAVVALVCLQAVSAAALLLTKLQAFESQSGDGNLRDAFPVHEATIRVFLAQRRWTQASEAILRLQKLTDQEDFRDLSVRVR